VKSGKLASTLAVAGAFALGAAIAALATGRVARAAESSPLSVRCLPDSISANEEGAWIFTVRLVNRSDLGRYGDSLLLIVTPAGAAPTTRRLVLPESAKSLSGGDSVDTEITLGASARRATLAVRFHSHEGSGKAFKGEARVTASGSVLEARFPPTVAKVSGREVELIRVPAPAEAANGGGVLVLPGEAMDAGDLLVPAWRLAQQGVSVVIVNAPGRGRSQGTDDFAGPASSAGALAGLDSLRLMPGVEPARIGAWGISRGGTLALRLALERPPVFAAVAAQGASYDLWASWRASSPAARAGIEAAAGRDSAGWRARSPVLGAASFRPELFVMHGERDSIFPAAPAHAFAGVVAAAGRTVVSKFPPQGQHALPTADATRFLQSRLSPP
jgi:dipeptidyl aminopeptidase/acylaminoacyl peptidase